MTDDSSSAPEKPRLSKPVTTKRTSIGVSTALSVRAPDAYTVVRSTKTGRVRFTYNVRDAKRQRENLLLNRGKATFASE